MKKKSKLRTILQAFTSTIPVDEPWFQERLEACEGCEYNSDNKEESELSFTEKTKINLACSEGSMCTACGCCLHEKLGQKIEDCGLIKIGETPKWRALASETSSVKDLDLEILNKTAESVDIELSQKAFVLRVGDVSETVKHIELKVTREAGLKISSIKATCGCTVPNYEMIDDKSAKLNVKVDTSRFTKDQRFEKHVTISYWEGKGVQKGVIKVVGHKKK